MLMIYWDYILAKIQHRYFIHQNQTYPYFIHSYHWTQYNERSIEIPIFLDLLNQYQRKQILEVGNVLSHYVHADHTIVDKYETGTHVINPDIVDFTPETRYDLIVSISTPEHVGKDEDEKDPDKPIRALNNLKSLLSSGGLLAVSIPLGWNNAIDTHIDQGLLHFDKIICFKRSDDGTWSEKPYTSVQGSPYSLKPYPRQTAIGLVIGYYTKPLSS